MTALSKRDQTVFEIEEIDGIYYLAYSEGTHLEHKPISSFDKERKDVWDFYNALCWEVPGKIDPYRGGRVDPYNPETIKAWILDTANDIIRYSNERIFFKDDRYSAILVSFVFNTILKELFDFAPRLILSGATNSGKSRLLGLLQQLCYRAYYSIRPTFSIMFRLLNMYGVTLLIDEAQRLKKDARSDVEDIFLNGTTKNARISRTNPNSMKVESFAIYGPMAISNKAGGFTAEDIDNRSFKLNFIPKKGFISPRDDMDELKRIRTDLYSIRALFMLRPDCIDFNAMIDKAYEELTQTDDNGYLLSDFLRADGIKGKRLANRSLQIATTYYTLSKLTSTEPEILSFLTEEDENNAERQRNTLEGMVFRAYVRCCGNSRDIQKYDYLDRMTSVTSKEIRDEYNNELYNSGNKATNFDEIQTNKVTRIMNDIGLTMERSTAHHNNSVVRRTADLEECLEINEDRYATEEENAILCTLRDKRGPIIKRPKKVNVES
mgnify:CR=1 FL=1